MIAIIDYRAGNLASVARALDHLGFECRVTHDVGEIARSDKVIFPGVGSAGQAMRDLEAMGLDRAIREAYESGKPFLGICLGTQIILEESEESQTTCLGLLPGTVRRFPVPLTSSDGTHLKVPHMGWNQVTMERRHPLFEGVPPESEFYFVHSFFPSPKDEQTVVATTDYGIAFASILAKKNLFAVQFHPEKSGSPGLTLLGNFCSWDGDDGGNL